MLYFESRSAARSFAAKSDAYSVKDFGSDAGKRWAVKVL